MATTVTLKDGNKMPLVGFGLWKVTKSACAETVYQAIKAGYRLLDGAGDYGNEKEAGEGVKRAIADGIIKREELFITSKVWNTFHKHEHVKAMAKHQLGLWGIDYFDLFLVHFPVSLEYVEPSHRYPPEWKGDDGKIHLADVPLSETWAAMQELVDEKLTKSIGVSNFTGSLLLDLLKYARIQPSVLQIELHPYLTQESMVELCKAFNIAITAYCSFGPQSWIELDMHTQHPSLFDQNIVVKTAKAHSKTPSQVLLRWATQRGIAVVPKSNNVDRLKLNLDCCSFDLTEAQMKDLNSLNQNLRMNDPIEMDPRMAIFA